MRLMRALARPTLTPCSLSLGGVTYLTQKIDKRETLPTLLSWAELMQEIEAGVLAKLARLIGWIGSFSATQPNVDRSNVVPKHICDTQIPLFE